MASTKFFVILIFTVQSFAAGPSNRPPGASLHAPASNKLNTTLPVVADTALNTSQFNVSCNPEWGKGIPLRSCVDAINTFAVDHSSLDRVTVGPRGGKMSKEGSKFPFPWRWLSGMHKGGEGGGIGMANQFDRRRAVFILDIPLVAADEGKRNPSTAHLRRVGDDEYLCLAFRRRRRNHYATGYVGLHPVENQLLNCTNGRHQFDYDIESLRRLEYPLFIPRHVLRGRQL